MTTSSIAHSPIALTIAGSDSGGGAGIQADIKTFSALGVYGASVITAITAQNTRTVAAVEMVSTQMIAAQIKTVLQDLDVRAIKIGMLSSVDIIQTVAKSLKDVDCPVVLDPVMVAKSGDHLLQANAIQALITDLFPLATLITPNLPEAATLLQCPQAQSEGDMLHQGRALKKNRADAVLMKGGHADGHYCTDILITRQAVHQYRSERIVTKNTHGTGCTLSSAIAAGLAWRLPLNQAVQQAHDYLHRAIAAADQLKVGSGHGPVDHFHSGHRHNRPCE